MNVIMRLESYTYKARPVARSLQQSSLLMTTTRERGLSAPMSTSIHVAPIPSSFVCAKVPLSPSIRRLGSRAEECGYIDDADAVSPDITVPWES